MSLDLKHDLVFARVAGEQMDDYVHAEVLYYPVGAISGMQMPQLTVGNWLETAWRLKALAAQLTPDQQGTVDTAHAAIQRVRSRVPDMYNSKARREFKSRLDTWTWYLDELLERQENKERTVRSREASGLTEPGFTHVPAQGQSYSTHVHVRFKLELLRDDVSQMQEQLSRLSSGDGRLRKVFTPGPFVWEEELPAHLPAEQYWWLYGKPA